MFPFEGSSESGLFRHWSDHVIRSPYFREYKSLEGHLFFSKCSIFDIDFENAAKNWQKPFCFLDNSIWIRCVNLAFLRREYLSSSMYWQRILRSYITLRETFSSQFPLQWSIIMINKLSCRVQQCLTPLTILLLEASSEAGLFGHLSNHVFCIRIFPKYISYEGPLFFQMFKIWNRIQKCSKKLTKSFLVLRFLHLNWLR